MKLHAWLCGVFCLSVVAIAQPKPTQAQMIGKWTGRLELIESQIPKGSTKEQINAARAQVSVVRFAFDFKKDGKFEVIINFNKTEKEHIKGTWRISGDTLFTKDEWRSGKAVPVEKRKEDKLKIQSFNGKVLTGTEAGMKGLLLRLTKNNPQ